MSAVPAAGAFHNVLAGRPNLEPALTTPWTKFKETTDRDSLKRFAVTCRVAGETGERKGRCAGSWPDRRTEAAKIQGVRTRAQFFGTTKCLGEQGSRLSCRHRARLRLQLARPLQSRLHGRDRHAQRIFAACGHRLRRRCKNSQNGRAGFESAMRDRALPASLAAPAKASEPEMPCTIHVRPSCAISAATATPAGCGALPALDRQFAEPESSPHRRTGGDPARRPHRS